MRDTTTAATTVNTNRDQWASARLALAISWVLALVLLAVVYERPVDLEDLYAAVDSGLVEQVEVGGGLQAGSTGYATVVVRWRQGWYVHRVEAVHANPADAAPLDTDREVVIEDLATTLHDLNANLDIIVADRADTDAAPRWLSLPMVGLWLASLFVLVNGPLPWRATRWGWFWLIVPPLGPVVFLVLSGPTRHLPPPRNTARRLTGGWAFVIALILGSGESVWWWGW